MRFSRAIVCDRKRSEGREARAALNGFVVLEIAQDGQRRAWGEIGVGKEGSERFGRCTVKFEASAGCRPIWSGARSHPFPFAQRS